MHDSPPVRLDSIGFSRGARDSDLRPRAARGSGSQRSDAGGRRGGALLPCLRGERDRAAGVFPVYPTLDGQGTRRAEIGGGPCPPPLNHGNTEDTETATEDSLRVDGTPTKSLRCFVVVSVPSVLPWFRWDAQARDGGIGLRSQRIERRADGS